MNMQEREQYEAAVEKTLTEIDVDLLNREGHSEDRLAILAVEHAARAQALLGTIDRSTASNLLLMLSGRFLRNAQAVAA